MYCCLVKKGAPFETAKNRRMLSTASRIDTAMRQPHTMSTPASCERSSHIHLARSLQRAEHKDVDQADNDSHQHGEKHHQPTVLSKQLGRNPESSTWKLPMPLFLKARKRSFLIQVLQFLSHKQSMGKAQRPSDCKDIRLRARFFILVSGKGSKGLGNSAATLARS